MIAATSYVPPFDPLGIPAPPWVFVTLMLVTFVLHLLLMNFALGGTLIAVGLDAAAVLGRRHTLSTTNVIIQTMPIVVSFTITTGVAPLLFVQVLYGQYFYSSNVFMGLTWLALVGVLMLGFYLAYVAVNHGRNALLGRAGAWFDKPGRRLVVVGLAAVCFLAIGWILTNNHVLSLRPEGWHKDGQWQRDVVYAGHRMVVPRYLHFVVGAVAVAGMWITAIGWWRRRRSLDDAAATAQMIRFGLWTTLIASAVNVAVGVTFLFHIGYDDNVLGVVKAMLLNPRNWMSLVFAVAVFALVPAHLATVLLALRQPLSMRLYVLAAGVLVLLITGMSVGREHLRLIYLARESAGGFSLDQWAVRPQASPLLMFLIVFVLGLATVGVMLKWAAARPTDAIRPATVPEPSTPASSDDANPTA